MIILEKKEVHLMKNLSSLYHATLTDTGGKEFDDVDTTFDKLAAKLTKSYCNAI